MQVWLDSQGKFVPMSLRRIGDSKRGGKMGRKPRADRPLKRSDSSCREASRPGTGLTQAGNTGSRRICPIAGRMKRNRERKQRLREKRCRGRNRDGPPHPATRTDAGRKSLEKSGGRHVHPTRRRCIRCIIILCRRQESRRLESVRGIARENLVQLLSPVWRLDSEDSI